MAKPVACRIVDMPAARFAVTALLFRSVVRAPG